MIRFLFTHPLLVVALLGWGVTAGWQWYGNLQDKIQWQQAAGAYQTAFEDAQESYTQLDTTMRQATLKRREIHGKATTALEGLNSVARQEIKKKMGGACGPYAARVVPRYYVDVLRLAYKPSGNSTSIKEQSASQRIAARLRAALARQAHAASEGVRE